MKEKIVSDSDRKIEIINLDSSSVSSEESVEASFHQPIPNQQSPSDQYFEDPSSQNSEQVSPNFMNLQPTQEKKKPKLNLNLKVFFNHQKTQECRQKERKSSHPNPQQHSTNQKQGSYHHYESQEDSVSIPSPDDFSSNEEDIKNNMPMKKPKLMAEIEQELGKPTEQLIVRENVVQKAQRKRQNKKRDYHIKKKFRELKKGKKKDNISNQVFNAIEQYFM